MATATIEPARALPRAPWGSLPARMRALHVTTARGAGAWLADALAADSASDVRLEKALGAAAGITRLRSELFDAVLVSHQPGELDAVELVEGIRAGSPDQAIIVLGAESEQEMGALCYEVGADAYLCVNMATTRALLWSVARAIEHHALIAENRRLRQADQQRVATEQREVEQLLGQQRLLIRGIEPTEGGDPQSSWAAESAALPEPLVVHYRELLRTYVIMGAGNLADEMDRFTDLMATAGVSAEQAMLLHLNVVEEQIRGLGSRSARHVMNRADLLVVDVMVHLAERYRQRYLDRANPPHQLLLPVT